MKKIKFFALLLSVVALTFASCKKDEDPEEPVTSETTYILGTYNTESFLMTNGQIHYFTRTDDKKVAAMDMALSNNGDLYIAGYLQVPGYGAVPKSLLYKNNVECSEYTFDATAFCGIVLKENGDIVIAGLHYGLPAVWDGTTMSELPVVSRQDIIRWDIASVKYVNGNELIVGEYMVDEDEPSTPVVWLNRQLVEVGQKDNLSTYAFAGTFVQGSNFKFAGSFTEGDKVMAYEYDSHQQSFTQIPYQWAGSNVSMVYGLVNSSKWNDPSNTIYSLVTEYYSHDYIDPTSGEIGDVDTINGGFYLLKNGQMMPETKFKYPQDNTLASVIDMSMNAKGEIILVGTLFDKESQDVRPAYWVNGECHIINPDRYDDGVASRVIVKSTQK